MLATTSTTSTNQSMINTKTFDNELVRVASNYLKNSVVSFGFFAFHTNETSPILNVVHQARFEAQLSRYADRILTVTTTL